MIERRDVMPINFLKKERFTGSYKGMRYRMEGDSSPGDVVAGAVCLFGDAGRAENMEGVSVYRGWDRKRSGMAE